MKKYILTVFGDFKSHENCKEIAFALSPLVDSAHLKFQHIKGLLIFHFASEMEMSDIHEFLEVTSYELYDGFILSEFTDKVSVFMDEDTLQHLFDLDNVDSECENIIIDKRGNARIEEDMEEDDEFVALLLNELKGQLKQPTIDQLLDKISSQGIQSLTPYEKGILDNYSN
jgi:hypothetical protein